MIVLREAVFVAVSLACLASVQAFQADMKSFVGGRVMDQRPQCTRKASSWTRTATEPASSALLSTMRSQTEESKAVSEVARVLATLVTGTLLVFGGDAAVADGATKKFSLPPISQSKDRCTFKSSAMGQANAARDSLYDLRECNLRIRHNEPTSNIVLAASGGDPVYLIFSQSGKSAAGFDLSGVIASEADFSNGDFKEVVMSKGYARNSKWDGADFTNAVVDRVSFDGSSMKGTIFKNAVLTSTSFEGANVEDADFTEAYMGDFDLRNLCKNPTLKGTNPVTEVDTRASAGCPSR